MRIIAGEFKGRPLKAPKGDGTRPTIDRVRESLMSSVLSARGGWQDAVVLDLFAGSGALGLEAISRGARFACFCEKNAAAFDVLRANVAMAGRDRVRLVRADVTRRLPQAPPDTPFDLVFLDPPYAMEADTVAGLLRGLRDAGSLAPGALVSYEHDAALNPLSNEAFVSLELSQVTNKRFGSTAVDLFRMGDA